MQYASPNLIGEFRTFGPAGPAYQVLGASKPLSKDDNWFKVQVLNSGELVDLPARQIIQDPKAA
ncbi:MAG: DUF5397 family protein [Cytophagales bacterium]|nr:DUF5397 family protein [Cytophagales bacterium]